MTFTHNLITLPELEQVNSSSGRYYVTPEGEHYSSVTTILGTMLDKGFLDDWIARVGEREAERIKNQAATRGTELSHLPIYPQPAPAEPSQVPRELPSKYEKLYLQMLLLSHLR
jgi:hypothetical protein